MENPPEEKKLLFRCPNPDCKYSFFKPLSWFQSNPVLDCPQCGIRATFDFDKMPGAKMFFGEGEKPE
jgi:hypothetical protein